MKITSKFLSLPPHLSTSWKNVTAIRCIQGANSGDPILVVQLQDGGVIHVPDLSEAILGRIFEAHAASMEGQDVEEHTHLSTRKSRSEGSPRAALAQLGELGLPFRIGIEGIEGMGQALQHDRSQSGAPDLPSEILSKVAGIAQMLGVENAALLPESEVGCNCFHCQIARAIHQGIGPSDSSEEMEESPLEDEAVSAEDLAFRTWDIIQSKETKNLYIVSNPVDENEQYTVFLGEPIGCTCGEKNCEHIKAVLRS